MSVTPNEYLDARRPEFLNAELLGRVVYEKDLKLVRIYDHVVSARLSLTRHASQH